MKWFCVAFAGVLLYFLCGCRWIYIDSHPVDTKVSLEPIKLDIGNVLQYKNVAAKCVLKNASSDSIEIVKLIGSCACTTGTASKKRLQPGESSQIDVKINTGDRTGDFGVYVDVLWKSLRNNESGILTLKIKAHATQIAIFEPAYLELGKIPRASKEITKKILVKPGDAGLFWDDLKADEVPDVQTTVRPVSSDVFEINCTVNPSTLPVGPFRRNIAIHLLRGTARLNPVFNVPLYAKITSDVWATPQTLFLGVFDNAKQQEGTFEIVSTNHIDLGISSIKSNNEAMRASFITKNKNNLVVHYLFDPVKRRGSVAGCFTIELLTPTRENISVPFIGFVNTKGG